ncbi:MAG TPA: hypothetical protein P5556_03030 [Candidatus Gastranaerophilales bacterium]|nr:hypothetical protein [Candidatus Gastranaerophilales bacterium]
MSFIIPSFQGLAAFSSAPLLLDNISNLSFSAVWSLIRELTSYTGYLCDIRIDKVGQPEYRVKYDANNVFSLNSPCYDSSDAYQGALGDLVGSDSAYCKKYYDQIGAQHVIQATDSAQPKIINAGSLITQNSSPVLSFDGGDWLQRQDAVIINQTSGTWTFLCGVIDDSGDTTTDQILDHDQNPRVAQFLRKASSNYNTITIVPSVVTCTEAKQASFNICSGSNDGTNMGLYVNNDGDDIKSAAGSATGAAHFTMGATWAGLNLFTGKLGAVIFANNTNTTDREAIRDALMTRYGVS